MCPPRHGTPPATAVADRLRQLAHHLTDDQIADTLNTQGFPTPLACLDPRRVRAVAANTVSYRLPLGTSQPGRAAMASSNPRLAKRLSVHPCMISTGSVRACFPATSASRRLAVDPPHRR